MKKILKIVLIIIMLNCISMLNIYADDIDDDEIEVITEEEINEVSNNLKNEPVINSRKCVIYDRTTQMVIYGKNETTKSAMASTTKIMTCIVVLENAADLNKIVEINAKAAGTGGSRLKLKKGDKITINDLLYGLMLRSRQ